MDETTTTSSETQGVDKFPNTNRWWWLSLWSMDGRLVHHLLDGRSMLSSQINEQVSRWWNEEDRRHKELIAESSRMMDGWQIPRHESEENHSSAKTDLNARVLLSISASVHFPVLWLAGLTIEAQTNQCLKRKRHAYKRPSTHHQLWLEWPFQRLVNRSMNWDSTQWSVCKLFLYQIVTWWMPL